MDPVEFQTIQHEISEARTPGTGASFVNGQIHQDWKNSDGGILWGKGMRKCITPSSWLRLLLIGSLLAGAGKTYLA